MPGEIVSFKYNLFFVLDGVKDDKGNDATGRVFMTFGGLKDPVKPEDCDYNNLFRSNYGQIEITASGKLGEHDLAVDPKFLDPTRNRTQAGVKAGAPEVDVAGAIDFLRTHPERMPEMVDWIRAGYVPTSPALKAVPNASGPTQGWIGAEPGRP